MYLNNISNFGLTTGSCFFFVRGFFSLVFFKKILLDPIEIFFFHPLWAKSVMQYLAYLQSLCAE